jgi:predicted esterase
MLCLLSMASPSLRLVQIRTDFTRLQNSNFKKRTVRNRSGRVAYAPAMRTLSVETSTHGRVLVEDGGKRGGLIVAFHGYAQSADDMLAELCRVPGVATWRVASVQALHRFYTRGDRHVVASWMTRQDRDTAVVDNVAYVHRVLQLLAGPDDPVVFAGFSQGASMAYRAAMLGRHPAAGIIALAGDVPPELKGGARARDWPPVLIGVGSEEAWYTADRLDADVAFLREAGADVDVVRFDGGHEWTDAFRRAAGDWLQGPALSRDAEASDG